MTRIAHHLAAIWFADIVGYTTLSSRDEDEAVRPFYLAIACAKVGRLDEAFEWLDRLVAERHENVSQIRFHPSFEPLRSDPRFEDLTRRIRPA